MTTTSDILRPEVELSFGYKLLSTPVPNMIHNIPAELKSMPANGGQYLTQRRYNPLNVAVVPLGNSGIAPPPQQLTAVDIIAKINFYGTYIALNEQVVLQNQDPVLNAAAQRLGISLRQSEDQLSRDMLAATASFIYCTGGTNGDNPTELTLSDVNEAITLLVGADAWTIASTIAAEDKYGTGPTRDAYISLGHSDLISTLQAVPGFLSKNQYPNPEKALKEEWGGILNFRYMLSSIGSFTPGASALGANIYNIFNCGLEAYAVIMQDRYSSSFIYRPPIYCGPLALNGEAGFKYAQVPVIQNDAWVLNQICTLAQ